MLLVCEYCGRTFDATRLARFCGRKCVNAHNNRRRREDNARILKSFALETDPWARADGEWTGNDEVLGNALADPVPAGAWEINNAIRGRARRTDGRKLLRRDQFSDDEGFMDEMRIEYHPRAQEQIKRHEGLRLTTYYCTAGALTIGYGHNLDANPAMGIRKGDKISQQQAEILLLQDLKMVAGQLDARFPWWRGQGTLLNEARQAVLLNMGFQMGINRLAKFERTLGTMSRGEWELAAEQMLESKWARQDSPKRAAELAEQMRTGEWQC